MSHPPVAPYVLIADDDAASRCYLGEGLRRVGARVALCADGTAALASARAERFDLLLLDCRMPGLDARGVLAAVRADPRACSTDSPAVASSAELDTAKQRALLAAGFCDTLPKPCTLTDLADLLARTTGKGRTLPVLDDEQALVASGTHTVVQALRGLFRLELVDVYRELDRLAGDAVDLHDRLHRLRSSCGFCGAPALAEHIATLQHGLKRGEHLPLADFRRLLLQTIDALEGF